MPSLDELLIGQSAKIARLDLNSSDAQRLLDMGLTVGVKVKLLKLAPLGDPLEILIRGYHLSLRKAEARTIEVEPIP